MCDKQRMHMSFNEEGAAHCFAYRHTDVRTRNMFLLLIAFASYIIDISLCLSHESCKHSEACVESEHAIKQKRSSH